MDEKTSTHTGTVGLMVAQLRDRKEHLEKELELLNVALDALEKAWSIDACLAKSDAKSDAQMNRLAAAQSSGVSPAQSPAQSPALGRQAPSIDLRGLNYGDAVEQLLIRMAERRELATRTLILRLGVLGKRVQGKDPYRTLYRTLLKDERFVRLNGKWALAEWFPPVPKPSQNTGEKAAEADGIRKERVN